MLIVFSGKVQVLTQYMLDHFMSNAIMWIVFAHVQWSRLTYIHSKLNALLIKAVIIRLQ